MAMKGDALALARAVRARRLELDLSPADVQERGGPNAATVRRIERVEVSEIRARTVRQLEHSLEWRDGVVDRIIDGTASAEDLSDRFQRVHSPKVVSAAGSGEIVVGGTVTGDSDLGIAARLIGRLDGYTEPAPEITAAVTALRAALPYINARDRVR